MKSAWDFSKATSSDVHFALKKADPDLLPSVLPPPGELSDAYVVRYQGRTVAVWGVRPVVGSLGRAWSVFLIVVDKKKLSRGLLMFAGQALGLAQTRYGRLTTTIESDKPWLHRYIRKLGFVLDTTTAVTYNGKKYFIAEYAGHGRQST